MKQTLMAILTSVFLSISVPAFAGSEPATKKINVNQATVQQLNESLVGVGPKIAKEIVDHRKSYGPYQSMEDLDKVKYVGSTVLEKNKDRIVFK